MKRKHNAQAVTRARKKVIALAKEAHGNRCKRCGYSTCLAALEFHHIDPANKEFGICDGQSRSLTRVLTEAKKCVMLCANCHRELHSGIFGMQEII